MHIWRYPKIAIFDKMQTSLFSATTESPSMRKHYANRDLPSKFFILLQLLLWFAALIIFTGNHGDFQFSSVSQWASAIWTWSQD